MELSEAIRLGSMATRPVRYRTVDEHGGACALGAALVAVGETRNNHILAYDHFPLTLEYAKHPIDGRKMLVLSIVRTLNDVDGWAREKIAEWVAEQEITRGIGQLNTIEQESTHGTK